MLKDLNEMMVYSITKSSLFNKNRTANLKLLEKLGIINKEGLLINSESDILDKSNEEEDKKERGALHNTAPMRLLWHNLYNSQAEFQGHPVNNYIYKD